MHFGSYNGVFGAYKVQALPTPERGCKVDPALLPQVNGSFHDLAPVRFSSYSDGLSTTALVAERTLRPIIGLTNEQSFASYQYGWTVSGNWGDTLVTMMFAPNAFKTTAAEAESPRIDGASSEHPGGLNVLMGDASVRFVKETISTWSADERSGFPRGASTDQRGVWVGLPKPGVWQALAGRNDGLPISGEFE